MKRKFNNSIGRRIRKGTSSNNERLIVNLFAFFKILLNVEPISIKLFIITFSSRFKKPFVINLIWNSGGMNPTGNPL
jgi:hypothetical protein